MIRMGRNNNTKTETANNQEAAANNQNNSQPQENHAPQNRAVTESESLARDIKEGRLSGFVGSGTVLTGETTFQSMLRIDGHLTGRIASEDGTLIIGSTGQVDANILVAAAMINGTVNGDVVATERLELGRTARVKGNIQSPRLVIEDGAILEGSCSMINAKENLEKRNAEQFTPAASENYAPVEEDDGYASEEEAAEAAAG